MSLYQCENCGCMENTALGLYWSRNRENLFDWTSIEDRAGKALCSACGPKQFRNGSETEFGKWHGQFERIFLPMGKFETNSQGNLQHKITGSTDIKQYQLQEPDPGYQKL